MAKRFVDTELWQKQWFQELSTNNKLLVLYIFQNCDNAGVWDINFRLASFIIGEPVSESDIDFINKKNKMFEKFDNDKIFVIDFIKFQYGTLSENCKPHKPIIEKLKKYKLYERVSKGYPKGIDTLSDTLEEKEKEKEKEKENTYIPSKEEILNYANNQLGKNIDVDSFIAYYDATRWEEENGFPINWKRKVITWANNYKPPEIDPTDRSHIFKELEEEARKAGKI